MIKKEITFSTVTIKDIATGEILKQETTLGKADKKKECSKWMKELKEFKPFDCIIEQKTEVREMTLQDFINHSTIKQA